MAKKPEYHGLALHVFPPGCRKEQRRVQRYWELLLDILVRKRGVDDRDELSIVDVSSCLKNANLLRLEVLAAKQLREGKGITPTLQLALNKQIADASVRRHHSLDHLDLSVKETGEVMPTDFGDDN